MEALRRSDDRLVQLRDGATRRAYVIGRISLFLETVPQVADSSDRRREIEESQREIEKLEADLSDEKLQERLDSILSVIGRRLTITEHADVTEDWYQAAVVERWRNGVALIPADWLTAPDDGEEDA
jgi:hypothetical protein